MTTKIVKADGAVLDAGNVLSCAYHSAVNAGTEVTLGSACSDYIEVSFWGDPGIGTGEKLTYYRVAEDGTETQIGIFAAQKPTAVSDNVYRVLAYDFMVRFETPCADWLARTAFPAGTESYTLNAFAAAVCAACGVGYAGPGALLNGDYILRPFALEQGTFRQLIQWIAEAGGCYAHMDPAGRLTFGWYTPAALSASPKADAVPYLTAEGEAYQTALGQPYYVLSRGVTLGIYSQSREDYAVSPVDALKIITAAGETVAGAGTNVYAIDGNPIFAYSAQSELQGAAEAILARLGALTYTPATVNIRDNTALRAGDLVTVYTGKAEAYTLAVMELTVSGGAMKLSATGSQRRDTPAAVSAQSRSYTKAQQLRDTGKLIQEALVTAQADIRGQNGGVRVDHTDSQGRVYETLYLDTMSEDTAVNVMRLNSQGIGFSTNGVNGDFTMALTVGGGLANQWVRTWELVADVITTGTLRGVEIIGEAGTMGGFTLSKDSLSAALRIDYPAFTEADLQKMTDYYTGAGTLTDAEKAKYDVNLNGVIDSGDAVAVQGMMAGTVPRYSVVKVTIDSTAPGGVITLEITEGYRAGVKTTIGAGGVFAPYVAASSGFTCGETAGVTREVTVDGKTLKFVGGIFAGVE